MSLRDATPPEREPASSAPRGRWRRRLRRAIYITAVVVAVITVSLLGVSQTAWFRDWLRRDIIARAERLLDARVTIARVNGDLISGITLEGVRLEQAGAPIITIDQVRVTYRVLTLRKSHVVLDQVALLRPVVTARQTPEGWTIARLVKPRVKPTGAAPIVFAIDDLRVYDARVIVQPLAPARPTHVDDLDALLAVSTGPSGARLEVRTLSMTLTDRGLRVGRLVGTLERHSSVVSLTNTRIDLARSHLKVDGNVRGVPAAPELELAVSSGAFAFDEMARLIPGLPSRPTQATFTATVGGPLTRLATQLDYHSPAGDARGAVMTLRDTGDPAYPLAFEGEVDLAHVDPGLWSNTKAVAGRVDGHAVFHVAPGSSARQVPTRGTFALTRANADVGGYSARDAEARGRFDGPRVTLARARGRAYGGAFDTTGTIGPRDPGQPGVRFDLRGHLSGIDVRGLPRPVPRINLRTAIAGTFRAHLDGPRFDATLTFDDSTVEGGAVRAGSVGRLALEPGAIRYGGTARIEGLDLGRLGTVLDLSLLRDPRVAGPITGHVEASLTGKTVRDLTLTAHATLDRATVTGGTAQHTTLQAQLADRRLDVDLDGDVAGVDPAVAFNEPAVRGQVNGHVKGHFAMPDVTAPAAIEGVAFDGDVTLGPSEVAGRAITSATMSIALADGILGVRRLEGTTPLGAVTASGPLALNAAGASDLAYTVRGLPLAGLHDLAGDLTGTVDVDGRLRGSRGAPQTDGTLRFADVAAGTAVAGVAGTSPFTIALPGWELARARVEAHPVLSAGTIGGLDLETGDAALAYADQHARFDVRASSGDRRLHVAGGADLSDATRRRITLESAGLSLGETTWVLDAARHPRVEVGADEVRLDGMHFDDGTGQIAEAAGTLALRAPAVSNLNVSVRGLDLLPLEALATEESPEFAGLLNGVARVTGTASAPDVLGSFAIERGRYRELGFERVAGAVHYDAGRIGVDVVVEQAPGVTLAVNGSVPLGLFTSSEAPAGERADAGAGNAPIDLRIESSAIGLQVATGLTTAITQVSGTANVKLHVTGTADNPLFDGGLTLAGGAFAVPATGRHYRDLATTVRFEPGRMLVDDLKMLDEEGDALEVAGVLGLRRLAFGDVQMHARAKRFGFVGNDLTRLEVDLELDVTGQVTRPTVAGTAVIESGRVEVDRVMAALDRDRTKLEPDDGVPIVGVGQRPAPPPAAPAPVPVQALPPRRERPAGAAGDAAAGTPAPAGAEGQARAPRGGQAGRAGGPRAVPTGTLWSRTALDIRVQIPENLLLRGQNIRRDSAAAGLGNVSLVVGGDFRVQKDRRRPTTLVGTVTTVRGSYEYYGRRFEILRDGRIQFQGADPSDPTLDLTARRIIQPSGIEARIRVQGTARTPTLSFSSTPPLDESDVLALIIFNRDLNSLGASEQGAVAAMAGTTAAGLVVSPLADTLGRKLGLEEIDVQTTNDSSGPGGVVTVGDQLGDRLFVRLRQQFGSQEVSELLLEYRLSELMRLQGSVADGDGVGRANRSLTRRVERGGLDLVFYYRY